MSHQRIRGLGLLLLLLFAAAVRAAAIPGGSMSHLFVFEVGLRPNFFGASDFCIHMVDEIAVLCQARIADIGFKKFVSAVQAHRVEFRAAVVAVRTPDGGIINNANAGAELVQIVRIGFQHFFTAEALSFHVVSPVGRIYSNPRSISARFHGRRKKPFRGYGFPTICRRNCVHLVYHFLARAQ